MPAPSRHRGPRCVLATTTQGALVARTSLAPPATPPTRMTLPRSTPPACACRMAVLACAPEDGGRGDGAFGHLTARPGGADGGAYGAGGAAWGGLRDGRHRARRPAGGEQAPGRSLVCDELERRGAGGAAAGDGALQGAVPPHQRQPGPARRRRAGRGLLRRDRAGPPADHRADRAAPLRRRAAGRPDRPGQGGEAQPGQGLHLLQAGEAGGPRSSPCPTRSAPTPGTTTRPRSSAPGPGTPGTT